MSTKEKAQKRSSVPKERQQFRALLLSNPNYFGNLAKSKFKAVKQIQANSSYEEIGCVGFQPQFNRLEAVVFIKNPSGYGGDICSAGTTEYVRFFMSHDDGATWDHLGLTSFNAYDVPEGTEGKKRLEYAATLQINPKKTWCFYEKICKVRAVLSWNTPPSLDPADKPVWGDIHDTYIQIDPWKFIIVDDLVAEANIELSPQLQKMVDIQQAIPAKQKEVLSLHQKHDLYKKAKISPARYALKEVSEYLGISQKPNPALQASLAELNIDITDFLDDLYPIGDGNTSYEELECVGYNPKLETLVATIRVKKSAGFSGGLCTAGSQEYVTFFADLNNNGTFETCLGTTSVNVHDIKALPKGGLEYAAFLPVDFSKYRQLCTKGPKIIPIRAILSWNVKPPCNPYHVPVWGNREDTLICLEPGVITIPGTHVPIIQTVGSMDVSDINGLGYANGAAALAGFTADDSPFGGTVVITGHIGNTTDFSAGAAKLKYKVEVSENFGVSWQRVDNNFTLYRDQLLNGVWSDLPPIVQSVDADGYYDYQEDLVGGIGNAQIYPVGNVLARWNTNGLSGRWIIRIVAKDPVTNLSWVSNVVTVYLDNTAPTAAIQITSGAGDCADFSVGDPISGTYSATDTHFHSLSLNVLPTTINGNPSGGSFTAPVPLPAGGTMPLVRRYNAGVAATGESGNWTLDTTGMERCGYVIEIGVWDRTIVNSGSIGRYARATVGLCLRAGR